jgi:para-nitrobenzyl esterase
MPKAKGLIHKMVPLSGSSIQAGDQESSRKLGEYILDESGLKPSEIDKLQEMPWKDYIELANRAFRKYAQENKVIGRGGFRPVADGINIPKGNFFSNPNGISSDVPMVICSTFHERSLSMNNSELENISEEKAKERLRKGSGLRGGTLGEDASKVYDAYKSAFPGAKPIELLNMIGSNRKRLIKTADSKVIQKSPVYVAWFGWSPPLFNNRMRAFHCSDICFWFYNTDLMLTHTGGGERPRKLSDKMSDALLQFMRTGNPNVEGLPEWPEYSLEKGETLILDDVCIVQNDPDREARNTIPD